jgi:cytochrome b
MTEGMTRKTRVWDLPTRVFHWLLAALAVGLLVTGKIGGDAMVWHARCGYAVGALLIFRLLWGAVGGHWSRFSAFAPSPAHAWRHLREADFSTRSPGHNPLGALSVYTMLVALVFQVASGLFSETKEDFAGPLTTLVSNATVHWLTGYHKNFGQFLLIFLVLLHVAAIAYYSWKGERLVGAMWHGDKQVPPEVRPSRDDGASRLAALVLWMASMAFIAWLVKLGG